MKTMLTDQDVVLAHRLDGEVFGAEQWPFESVDKVREVGFGVITDDQLGYCLVRRREAYDEVLRIGVIPAGRRHGLGEKLLQEVIERSSARFQLLTVRADNAPAKALYRRHGFVPMGLLPTYYADKVDGVVMGREAKLAA